MIAALEATKSLFDKPICLLTHNVPGKGVSYMVTEPGWHLGYLDPEDAKRAIAEIEAMEI